MSSSDPIRIVNLGPQPAVRTQSVYHAIAQSTHRATPDTIILTSPAQPYVCIGYHQNAEAVDSAACARLGLPIVRRLIGGGATYLDSDQLFYQFIFNLDSVPSTPQRMYHHLLNLPLMTLQRLGFEATLRDDNELEVGGQRIAGIGGGFINDRAVVVGNFLFDFNFEAMSQIWASPWPAVRELATSAGRDRITTLRAHQSDISMESVITAFIDLIESVLGRSALVGDLTDEELQIASRLDDELVASDHLNLFTSNDQAAMPPLKITGGVFIHADLYGGSGGNYRSAVRVRDGQIELAIVERWDDSEWQRTDADLAGMAYASWTTEREALYA